jgi:hypothetical protein
LTLLSLLPRFTHLKLSLQIIIEFLNFLQDYVLRFPDLYEIILKIWLGIGFVGQPYTIGSLLELPTISIIGFGESGSRYAHLLPLHRRLATLDYVKKQVRAIYPHISGNNFTITYEGFFSQTLEIKDDASLIDALRSRPYGVRFTIHHSYTRPDASRYLRRNLTSVYSSRIPPLDAQLRNSIRGRELTITEFHNAYSEFLKSQGSSAPSMGITNFLFEIFDQDNNGHISEEEFLEGVQLYYHQKTELELEKAFVACSENQDYITEDGFIKSIQQTRQHKGIEFSPQDVIRAKDAFAQIDTNHDNHLQFIEYRTAVLTKDLFVEKDSGRVQNI